MAHDMETGDTRFTGLVEVDRPAHVEYRKQLKAGRRGSDEWMGPVTMESFNTVDGPKREVVLASAAQSESGAPPIVTRAEWGADETLKRSTGGCKRTFHPLQQIFVHHTAGSNYDYNGAATMRAIYAYHTQSRGWCDLGYNFVIDWSGTIYEGRWARRYAAQEPHDSEDYRDYVVAGAHVAGFNSGSVGISLMGNFTSIAPPVAMKQSLKAMLAWEADRHGLNPTGTHSFNGRTMRVIGGHRDAGQTACPGNKVYELLPNFRRKVAGHDGRGPNRHQTQPRDVLGHRAIRPLGGGRWSPRRRVWTTATESTGDDSTESTWGDSGRLTPPSTTGTQGEFSTTTHAPQKVALSASFSTNPGYWGSDSRVARREREARRNNGAERSGLRLDGSVSLQPHRGASGCRGPG